MRGTVSLAHPPGPLRLPLPPNCETQRTPALPYATAPCRGVGLGKSCGVSESASEAALTKDQ